ncbi:MAG TPA: C10 family peptidase [Syntrophobacteraceae bacterium]|nr:C10 family peptidase [Syntrophobacteraceae bacterium]
MNPIRGPKERPFARFSNGAGSISIMMSVKSVMLSMALLLFFASGAWARPTTEDEALNVAVNWLSLEARPMGSPLGHEVKKVETFTDETGNPTYYAVHLLPSGLIFLPADDRVEPIMGFLSDATSYDPSPANPLGALVSRDIPGRVAYAREMEANVLPGGAKSAADSRMAGAQRKWVRLSAPVRAGEDAGPVRSGGSLSNISNVQVAPLVQTQWNQACANGSNPPCNSNNPDVYNYYTPQAKPCKWGDPNNYVCGSGATALAQLMFNFGYPTAPVGILSGHYNVNGGQQLTGKTLGGDDNGGAYQWGKMPLTSDSSTTLTQQKAIGRLTWDAALSLDTDFTKNGSVSGWDNAPNALLNFFQYSNAKSGDNAGNNLPEAALMSMINPNLNAKHPVILAVQGSSGGHLVVCDGYGYNYVNEVPTIYHHLNMGWSGQDDVWYNLPTIETANGYNYTSVHECTYNIYTSGTGEIVAGIVVAPWLMPLPGQGVQLGPTHGGGHGKSRTTTTDSNGNFAFTQVPSNTAYTITITGENAAYYPPQNVSTAASTDFTSTTGNVWTGEIVALWPSSMSLTSSKNPSRRLLNVTFTANIETGPDIGNGTVRFMVNGANVGSAVPVFTGHPSLLSFWYATTMTYRFLYAGTYTVTASFTGSSKTAPCTCAAPVTQVVTNR